jgi:hypothetical protein
MLKLLNCVDCERINKSTKIYPSETSVGFPFNLYLGISSYRMYSRYSDVIMKNGMWREIWIRDIEGILMISKR